MTFSEKLAKYARLLVGLGVNVQPGQYLLLDIDAENYPLARALTREAMERGAADVIIHWSDMQQDHDRAKYGKLDDMAAVSDWETGSYAEYIEKGACSLRIIPAYPTQYEDCDPKRAAEVQKHANNTRNILRKGTAEKGMHWCIGTAPSENWANYLFPELDTAAAVEKLWNVLFDVCLIDENDPIDNWLNSMNVNGKYAGVLNANDVDTIHYTNGLGTDITVGFQPDVFWVGGGMTPKYTPEMFLPNIPTRRYRPAPISTAWTAWSRQAVR